MTEGVIPLKISKRQSGRIKKEGMTAFHAFQQVWIEKLRNKGHGGDWGPERYRDDGPVIFASAPDKTKKVGHIEAMQRAADEQRLFILPTTASIKLNPDDDEWVDVRKTTDAVERFQNSQVIKSLYPDANEMSMAKMMQERGPFRAAFEAQTGKAVPHGRPVKVTGEMNKRIRAQILGLQPTDAEKLSARQTQHLRKRIRARIYSKYEEYLTKEFPDLDREELLDAIGEFGSSEEALMEAILSGHQKFIDKSPKTIKDFKRMVLAYSMARKANTHYMQKILPRVVEAFETMEVFAGFDQKFLNAIAPTADYMIEPSVIHLIYDIETASLQPAGDFWDRYWLRYLTGEPVAEPLADPAFVKANLKKSAYRFMAAHDHDDLSAAKAILEASRQAFLSDRGMADIGLRVKNSSPPVPPGIGFVGTLRSTADKDVAAALDKADKHRINSTQFKALFSVDSKPGEAYERRMAVMTNLVSRNLAFPIATVKLPKKGAKPTKKQHGLTRKEKKKITPDEWNQRTADFEAAMQQHKRHYAQIPNFYIIPLFSSGFSKQPKGWDSRWVIPAFQIMDEYSDVLTASKKRPSALELLYLIATRAKALYDYELNESETLLLYSMLDPHDPDRVKKPRGEPPEPGPDDEDGGGPDDEDGGGPDDEDGGGLVEDVVEGLAAAADEIMEELVGDGEGADRGRVIRNMPPHILPPGVTPASLGDPFDEARAEYIFKRLTDKVAAKHAEELAKKTRKSKGGGGGGGGGKKGRGKKGRGTPPVDPADPYGKDNAYDDDEKVKGIIEAILEGKSPPPTKEQAGKAFTKKALSDLFTDTNGTDELDDALQNLADFPPKTPAPKIPAEYDAPRNTSNHSWVIHLLTITGYEHDIGVLQEEVSKTTEMVAQAEAMKAAGKSETEIEQFMSDGETGADKIKAKMYMDDPELGKLLDPRAQEIEALKIAYDFIDSHYSDEESTSRASVAPRPPSAYHASSFAEAVKITQIPDAAGYRIMVNKKGEYRVVDPRSAAFHQAEKAGFKVQTSRKVSVVKNPSGKKAKSEVEAATWRGPGETADSFEGELASVQTHPSWPSLGLLLLIMDHWNIRNGKALYEDYYEAFPIDKTRKGRYSPQEQVKWASEMTNYITRDHNLRGIWQEIISKRNPSGMRTKSEVEAAAQTRADKIQAPVYIWHTKGGHKRSDGSQDRPGWGYSERPPSSGKYFTIEPTTKKNAPVDIGGLQKKADRNLLLEMEAWVTKFLDPAIEKAMARHARGDELMFQVWELTRTNYSDSNPQGLRHFNYLGDRYAASLAGGGYNRLLSAGKAWGVALRRPRQPGSPGLATREQNSPSIKVHYSQSQDFGSADWFIEIIQHAPHDFRKNNPSIKENGRWAGSEAFLAHIQDADNLGRRGLPAFRELKGMEVHSTSSGDGSIPQKIIVFAMEHGEPEEDDYLEIGGAANWADYLNSMTGGGKVAEGAPFKAIPIEGGQTSFGVWAHLFQPGPQDPFWRDINRLGKIWVVARKKSKKNPTCSYRTTKRSKACGGRVALMKNGRIYKCASCGAKYEMR